MFVPDEEAAHGIDCWAQAVQAIRTGELWPEWPPTGAAFSLILPGGAGLCVSGDQGVGGRAVAARGGGALAGVRHLHWEEAGALGIAPPEDEAEATLSLQGHPVYVVSTAGGNAAAMARALARRAFGGWWSGRAGAGRGDGRPPAPDPSAEAAALAEVEGRLVFRALTEDDPVPLALQVALVRRERRLGLADGEVAAQEQWEVEQGVPAYVGGRAAATLGGAAVGDIASQLAAVARLTAGRRLRLIAHALCVLLDRLEGAPSAARPLGKGRPWAPRAELADGWKMALTSGRAFSLQILLESHVRFDGGSRDDSAFQRALTTCDYVGLLQGQRERAAEADRARQALVDAIALGGGTLMVFDVRALGPAKVEVSGAAQSIHTGMTVYPQGARFQYVGGTRLAFTGIAVAEDRRSALLQTRVDVLLHVRGDGGRILPDAEAVFEQGLHLRLPGVDVRARTGVIQPIDGGYLVRVLS